MKLFATLIAAFVLTGCGAVGRLQAVGKAPGLTPAAPAVAPAIEPSLGDGGAAHRGGSGPGMRSEAQASASLFRTGAGAFLRDQRASKVGDILTLRINISDKADMANSTSRSRAGGESSGIASMLGLEQPLTRLLPGNPDPAKLVDTRSKSTNTGSGNTSRKEDIAMTMAAIVTGVLPNGNLVIRGRQEIRVNFELRELVVTGIIRPEDIAPDNSISHSRIAEARVIYGGRGQLTDAQQARWGQQIYDALFPF